MLYFADEFFAKENSFKYVKPRFVVVYVDDNVLVVNKPVGLLCHSDEDGNGDTLVDMVRSYLYDTGE